MKKKSFPITNIGTISLMTIFIILCMVTFAALSLSAAANDARSGQKIAEHTLDYYTASNQAEAILADADVVFANAYQTTTDADEYYRLISEGMPDTVTAALSDGGLLEASYQVTISASQALDVRLAIFPPQQIQSEKLDAFYKIVSWQVIQTDTWEGDNTLHLIQ